jgi:hypothetical protein
MSRCSMACSTCRLTSTMEWSSRPKESPQRCQQNRPHRRIHAHFPPHPTGVIPEGEQKVLIGALGKTATHYVLKPRLGIWLKVFATLLNPRSQNKLSCQSRLLYLFFAYQSLSKGERPLSEFHTEPGFRSWDRERREAQPFRSEVVQRCFEGRLSLIQSDSRQRAFAGHRLTWYQTDTISEARLLEQHETAD